MSTINKNKKISKTEEVNQFDIAVIGYAARLPQADNVSQFWDNLKKGKEGITFYTKEELRQAGVKEELINSPNYVRAAGKLEGIEYFDANFFGYTPKEAQIMDPQIRLFHEIAQEALDIAGYNPKAYQGSIGVYAGAVRNYQWEELLRSINQFSVNQFSDQRQLNNSDWFTTRLSSNLELKGPSCTVNTACSTSLVAIHLAVRAVLNSECNMALAGGVVAAYNFSSCGYLYEKDGAISPDGHNRSFDANAGGTIFGDGLGIVVLKRLSDAICDNDNILAVIKGSAINNDGSQKASFSAPSVDGQATVIADALHFSQVNPETITYVEAHGTATPIGDPIEVEALTRAFATKKRQYCAIGSVKSNIGHLDVASGVAGFIKTVLALQHKQIPASINYEKPNPRIDFKRSPFFVNTKLRDWKRINKDTPLRAGVSSFGVGGTNAHVILEEAPELAPTDKGQDRQLIILSAKTPTALNQMRLNLIQHLTANPNINLADVAFTLQLGRAEFSHRLAVVCPNNTKQAIKALKNQIATSQVKDDTKNIKLQSKATRQAQLIIQQENPNLTKLAALWLKGAAINWNSLYQKEQRRRIPLPTYPFERQRYWIEEEKEEVQPAPKSDIADWFYVPDWQASPGSQTKSSAKKTYLILANAKDQLAAKLKAENDSAILVESGQRFKQLSENHYRINIKNKSDYVKLFNQLKPSNLQILHLLTLAKASQELTINSFNQAQDRGLYSLIYLAQSLDNQEAKLSIITNNLYRVDKEDIIDPAKATMLGPIRVIPQEYNHIKCQLIDAKTDNFQLLINELNQDEPIVALRGDQRYTQTFKQIKLLDTKDTLIKQNGIYLILGGLGGIGYTLAQSLAKDFKANLILIGRSKLNPAKQAQIKQLAKLGASRTLYQRADIGNQGQLTKAIKQIQKHYPVINGIIHAAGEIDKGGIIQRRDKDTLSSQLAVKAYAPIIINQLIKPEFIVYCSSISSIRAPFGEVGYVAANNFLDSFAQNHSKQLAINWPAWQRVGMAEEARKKKNALKNHPLFDACLIDAPGIKIYETTISLSKFPLLADHRIFHQHFLVPGTFYVSLIYSASQLFINQKEIELNNIYFIQPLLLIDKQDKRKLRLTFVKNNDAWSLLVASQVNPEQDLWQEHCQGSLTLSSTKPQQYNIKELSQQLKQQGAKEITKIKNSSNDFLQFGARWRSVKRVINKANRYLSFIELPSRYRQEAKAYHLHPAIFDVALAVPLLISKGLINNRVPLGYKKVTINNYLYQGAYSLIEHFSELNKNSLGSQSTEANVIILDKSGREMATVEKFITQRIRDIENFKQQNIRPSQSANSKINNFSLTTTQAGTLDSLAFVASDKKSLQPNEAEIEVKYTALIFRDVLLALNMIPSPDKDIKFGFECSGIVKRIGSRVKGIKAADEVIVLGSNCFSERLVVSQEKVILKPKSLTLADASAVLVAFSTAYYMIKHCARAKPGQSILIHSATGGVGLAAIQIAKWLNLKVFATAGNEEKRSLLKYIGVDYVMDSRTTDFAKQIMDITNNRGVDMVLSSTVGDIKAKSLEVLAKNGRFLEIGIRDDRSQDELDSLLKSKNAEYHLLLSLKDVKQSELKTICREIINNFNQGIFRPLPHKLFNISDVKSAFKFMADAKHIGKIIVSWQDKEKAYQQLATQSVPGALVFSALVNKHFADSQKLNNELLQFNKSNFSLTSLQGQQIASRLLVNTSNQQVVISNINPQPSQARQFTTLQPLQLTQPLHPRPDLTTAYAASLNNIQEKIISIWQELFGYDQIGINDNFFDLGGDSLKAVQVVSQINQQLKVDISVATIFNSPTVKGLSIAIKTVGGFGSQKGQSGVKRVKSPRRYRAY